MDLKNITFLTDEQVFGDNQLDILKKYGTKCAITDFSILLGGCVSEDSYTSEGNSEKDRTGWWWTKTPYNNDTRAINVKGISSWAYVNDRNGGARPALPYSSISSIISNKVRGKDGILEVEYGEYPQTVVSEDFSRTLEKLYRNKKIKQTGKKYTTDDCARSRRSNASFHSRNFTEYEYNGKKYIRFVGDLNGEDEEFSDGRIIDKKTAYWIEVEPIKWLVDEKANIALSKKIIFSGVQFNNKCDYEGDFENTDIYKFLTTYFIKDILSNEKNIKQEENNEKSEIDLLFEQIEKYADYSNNKKELYSYLNQLIEEYNNNVENLLNNQSQLKLDTANGFKTKLIVKLETILDSLKVSYEKRYIYEEITKLLDDCNKILLGKDINTDDELISDFKNIRTCLTFTSDATLMSEFFDLIHIELKKIRNYLSYSYEEKNKIEYVDKKTFELYFRGKLHPLLVKLHISAVNKDVINEISKMTQNQMYETIEKQENSVIDFYLKQINEEINIIRNLDLNNEYKAILDELLNIELNNLGDINTTCKMLTDILCKLYEIEIIIKEKHNTKQNIKKYKISKKFDVWQN